MYERLTELLGNKQLFASRMFLQASLAAACSAYHAVAIWHQPVQTVWQWHTGVETVLLESDGEALA
jgi:hypothetical protein